MINAVIPARLDSKRFPRKVLADLYGLPIIEHVRRRTLRSGLFDRVVVATPDREIERVIAGFNGEVIMTDSRHPNGTSRVSEAIQEHQSIHTMIVQGDEPLISSHQLITVYETAKNHPEFDVVNLTSSLQSEVELRDPSMVKATIGLRNQFLFCYRTSPSVATYETNASFTKKVLGLFAFKTETLKKYASLAYSLVSSSESIEQLAFIDNDLSIKSAETESAIRSVNTPEDLDYVMTYIQENPSELELIHGYT